MDPLSQGLLTPVNEVARTVCRHIRFRAAPPIIDRMVTIRRTVPPISIIKIIMALSMAHPTIILNPPIAVHSAEANLPTAEQIKSVMVLTAGTPVLTPAVLRVGEGVAISIAHNGLPRSLMAAVARVALESHKPITRTRRRLGHRQHMASFLLVRLSPRAGPDLGRLGLEPLKEKMREPRLHQENPRTKICLHQMNHKSQHLQQRAANSALRSRQRPRQHLPQSPSRILHSECKYVNRHLAYLSPTHRRLATG